MKTDAEILAQWLHETAFRLVPWEDHAQPCFDIERNARIIALANELLTRPPEVLRRALAAKEAGK